MFTEEKLTVSDLSAEDSVQEIGIDSHVSFLNKEFNTNYYMFFMKNFDENSFLLYGANSNWSPDPAFFVGMLTSKQNDELTRLLDIEFQRLLAIHEERHGKSEEEEKPYNDKTCGCSSFCYDCLGMSWSDFL